MIERMIYSVISGVIFFLLGHLFYHLLCKRVERNSKRINNGK